MPFKESRAWTTAHGVPSVSVSAGSVHAICSPRAAARLWVRTLLCNVRLWPELDLESVAGPLEGTGLGVGGRALGRPRSAPSCGRAGEAGRGVRCLCHSLSGGSGSGRAWTSVRPRSGAAGLSSGSRSPTLSPAAPMGKAPRSPQLLGRTVRGEEPPDFGW